VIRAERKPRRKMLSVQTMIPSFHSVSHPGLCCFKAKEQVVISKLEFHISQRQKQFGVDYLTLAENRASQQELKDCLKEALKDINELQREIDEHQDAVNIKEGEVTGVAPQNETEETPEQSRVPSRTELAPATKAGNAKQVGRTKQKMKGKKSSDPKESDFNIADE
jgi:hypothetical protein